MLLHKQEAISLAAKSEGGKKIFFNFYKFSDFFYFSSREKEDRMNR